MIARRLAVSALALVLFACGGSKPPPLAADNAPAGSSDPSATDPSSASPPADPAGAPAEPAPAGPGPVSCVTRASCSETTVGGKDASDAKDRCKAASGEPKDGECSRDDVLATCAIESKNLTIYFYKADKDPEAIRGMLKGGKTSCKGAGGTFTPSAKAGGGAGAAKKKPAKKK